MTKTDRSATFPGLTRRHALFGGLLAAASGVAYARQPEVANPIIDQDLFESWIPRSFGSWETATESGVLLPPPDTLRDRLYDNLATRVLVSPEHPPVMLLLAYNNAQDGVVQVHRPEVCYPVGGFALSETRDFQLTAGERAIPANLFTATGPSRVEQVAYFTRMGTAFPRSWADQRLAVMRANLAGVIPDGMLMRISVLGMDQAQAAPLLGSFFREFLAATNPRLTRLLVG